MTVHSPDGPEIRDALRTLGFPEKELPDAIKAFVTPQIARRWVEILGPKAFSRRMISAIPASGFDAEGYLRWREAGLAERDALTLPPKLASAGLELDHYRRWRSAGFAANELTKLLPNVTKGLDFDEALGVLERWYHIGESSVNGAVFELREVLRRNRTISDLRHLITNDFSGHQVYMWVRNGITDTAWAEWLQTGVRPRKAAGLDGPDISPATAKQWADAGLDASDIENYINADIPVDDAIAWARAGVDALDVEDFSTLGISPSQMATYGVDGLQPYQVSRTGTGYTVKLEPWQKDPADQLPQVIEPGRISLSLWSSSPWQDEPLESALSLHWDGKHTVDWSARSGTGMSMNSEISFSGIAGWPDGKNVELTYTKDSGERGIDWLASAAPTAGAPDGARDPQRWVQLARSLVDLTEALLDSGIESDDQFTRTYYEPATGEHLGFDELFRVYLSNIVPGSTSDFKDWFRGALEAGNYTIDQMDQAVAPSRTEGVSLTVRSCRTRYAVALPVKSTPPANLISLSAGANA